MTIQVLVLGGPGDDDEVTAGPHDLEELGEAGWIRHSIKGLEVCVRVAG